MSTGRENCTVPSSRHGITKKSDSVKRVIGENNLTKPELDISYALPPGGLPAQSKRLADRAVFTTAYAFIPKTVMTDIVTSALPFWERTRLWVLARPLSGFAETFSHYLMEVGPNGGSDRPDDDAEAEHVLFVTSGTINLAFNDGTKSLNAGGYAYLPAGFDWSVRNEDPENANFHWIRKRYQPVNGIPAPEALITSDAAVTQVPMPDTEGVWATSHFVDPRDLRHDMHVNIVTFQPGGVIPFAETHVMEHGLYVLQGKGLLSEWRLERGRSR